MYVLHWDSDDTNTDTYGSQINYQNNGTVHYQNELQPAGKKIHWWETHYYGDPDPLNDTRYGSKRLPQLPRNQTFSLSFSGSAEPENSVGLTVMSFDESGQLLNQKMTLESELNFDLDDDEKEYEIALVKFNNTKLLFRGLLTIPESMLENYQIKSHLEQGFIDFIPRNTDKTDTVEIMVRTFHRIIDAIELPERKLNVPVRVVLINDSWNSKQLQHVGNDFQKQFQQKRVKWMANDLKAQNLLNSVDMNLKRK